MSGLAPIDAPPTRSWAATVGIVAIGVAIVNVASLHVLRQDLPPLSSRLSLYAVGPSAPVMAVAFVATAVGLVAVAAAVLHPDSRVAWRRSTGALLWVSGVAMAATAAFPTAGAGTTSEVRHSVASALATVAALAAGGLQSLTLFDGRRRATTDRVVAVLGLAALVPGAVSPFLHDTPLTGLSQRVLWLVLAAWLARVAWVLERPHGARGS